MKNILRMPALFDIYGNMFTDKQREFFILYYHYDLSLGEIAEEHGVTRQAVHDGIRRTEMALENFEDKLGFLQYQEKIGEKLTGVLREIESLEDLCQDNDCINHGLKRIRESITHIIKG